MRWFAFRGHALWKRPSFKNETGALRKRQVLGEKGGVCSEGRALRARDGWFPSAVSGSLTSRGVLPWTPVEHGQSSHGFPFLLFPSVQFSSVTQLCLTLCNPMDCSTPGLPVHHQLPEFTQTHVQELVMPSNHLILCRPLLLLPSIFPSIRVFSNESVLCIRWPQDWSFSFSISPSNEHSGLIFFRMDWLDRLAVQGTLKSSPTPQFKSINSLVLSFVYGPLLISIDDYWKNYSFE